MSINVPGVPEAISREAYVELVASIGLDPHNVIALEFGIDGVYATVYALDPDGRPRRSSLGAAEHRVFIPVVDGAEQVTD